MRPQAKSARPDARKNYTGDIVTTKLQQQIEEAQSLAWEKLLGTLDQDTLW